jgi:hypothetical protein
MGQVLAEGSEPLLPWCKYKENIARWNTHWRVRQFWM